MYVSEGEGGSSFGSPQIRHLCIIHVCLGSPAAALVHMETLGRSCSAWRLMAQHSQARPKQNSACAGAEDVFMEFDFEWRGQQNIALSLNPAPKVLSSIPLVKQIVDYTMSWSVSPPAPPQLH